MALSGLHTAYYIVLFITMVFIILLHMIALAGDKWLDGNIAGSKINEGLWVSCVKRFVEKKCIMFTDNIDKVPGNQIRFFLTTVLLSLRCYYWSHLCSRLRFITIEQVQSTRILLCRSTHRKVKLYKYSSFFEVLQQLC